MKRRTQAILSISESNDNSEESSSEEKAAGGSPTEGGSKALEINDDVFYDEIILMEKDAIWDIEDKVFDEYDFGMFMCDTRPFKSRMLTHLRSLLAFLRTYACLEFLRKMK